MGDELKELEQFAKRIDAVKSLTTPASVPFALVSTSELLGYALIQNKNAFISESQYRKGEAPGYRDHFKTLHPRLPETKTPTPVYILFIEDGMSPSSDRPLHGRAAAATGSAAWEALTGEKHLPGLLMNRMPYEDVIGFERKPLLGPKIPDRHKNDLALPALKMWLKSPGYKVISTSTNHKNDLLKSAADRILGQKRLDEFFGPDAVFVQSVGNYTNSTLELRHSAYAHHPSSLQVGACQGLITLPATVGRNVVRGQHLESYSSYGPDIVCETNPPFSRYIASPFPGETKYESLEGTSFSSPQAASIVGALLKRFAISKENPQALLTKEDILLALRQTAQPLHVRETFSLDTLKLGSTHLLELYRIGNNYISEEAGCGCIDTDAAWKHLETMETAVRSGTAQMKRRETVSIAVDTPAIKANAEGYYSYPVDIKGPLHTDAIALDLITKSAAPSLPFYNPPQKFYLADPQGGMLQLFPSQRANLSLPSAPGNEDYRMARTTGFHGVKMEGTWRIISSIPLQSADIHFVNAMQPGHVAVTHPPNEAERFADLYRSADLRNTEVNLLDKRLMMVDTAGKPFIAQHNFSQAAFPADYLETRLLMLAADDKQQDAALALAWSHHPAFEPRQKELKAAIESHDMNALIALLYTDDASRLTLVENALKRPEPAELYQLLAEHGFMGLKGTDGMPVINKI